jgi:hypothetical protein
MIHHRDFIPPTIRSTWTQGLQTQPWQAAVEAASEWIENEQIDCVLCGFARVGSDRSREGTKARRGKAGLGFVFFAASRASEPVAHAKTRRREEKKLG